MGSIFRTKTILSRLSGVVAEAISVEIQGRSIDSIYFLSSIYKNSDSLPSVLFEEFEIEEAMQS